MLKKSLAFLLAMTMAFTTIPVHPAYAVEEPVEESDLAVMDEGEESEQQIGEWLELHYAYPNDCDQILPNRDMDITLWVGRVWYYSDDNQGAEEIEEYLIDITDVEGNPLENAIVDAEYTGNNTLHVSSMGSEGDITLRVTATAAVEGVEFTASENIHVGISKCYYYIQDPEFDVNMKVGEGREFSPTVLVEYEDEESWATRTEPATGNFRYAIDYDERAFEVLNADGVPLQSGETTESDAFTINRRNKWGSGIDITAELYYEENEQWEEVAHRGFWFPGRDYFLNASDLRGGDGTWIFDDERMTIHFDTDVTDDYDDYTYVVDFASYAYGDEDGSSRLEITEGWSLSQEDGSIELDGSILKNMVDPEERNFGLWVAIVKDECTLAETGFGIDMRQAAFEYHTQYGDGEWLNRVPGNDIWIGEYFGMRVQNAENPWGIDLSCQVTNVSVSDPNVCTVEKDGDWKVQARDYGTADVTVTYVDAFGEERQYNFTLNVCGEVVYLNLSYPHDNEQMLKNSTMEIGTSVWYEWNFGEGNEGSNGVSNYVISIDTDEQGNPCYDTNLLDVEVGEDGQTLIVTSKEKTWGCNIGLKATCLIPKDTPETMEAYNSAYVNVTDGYYYLEDFNVDPALGLGEAVTIYPQAKNSYVSQEGIPVIEDASGRIRYRFEYDENCVEITDDESDGFLIKRIGNWGTSINVIAEAFDAEEDNWYEITRRTIELEGLWYDIQIENLRREWENYTWVFTDEDDYTVSAYFEGVEEASIEWELISRNNEEGFDDITLTKGYCVNEDGSITFDGAVLENSIDHRECHLRVKAKLMIDGLIAAEKEFGIGVEYPDENYIRNDDMEMLPDRDFWIDRVFSTWTRNKNHPDGEDVEYAVTEVVVETIAGDNVCSLEEEMYGWNIHTNSSGSVKVTVYETCEDGEVSYSFNIYVNGDILHLNYAYPQDTDWMLMNSEMQIVTELVHEWNHGEDDQGTEVIDNYTLEIAMNDDGNPCYDTNLLHVGIMEDGRTLNVESKDHCWGTEIPVNTSVVINEGTEDAFTLYAWSNISVNVTDFYYYMDMEWNSGLKMGEFMKVTPKVMQAYVDENGDSIQEEVMGDVEIRTEYDDASCTIRQSDGCYSISRKAEVSMHVRFIAELWEDDHWNEITARDLYLDEIPHECKITYLWGANGVVCRASAYCIYDLEDCGTEWVHAEEIDRIPENCTTPERITYLAGFENEQFEDQMITVDGTPAIGHTEVVDAAVEATYTKPGLTEGKHCSVCGEVLEAQKEIAVVKLPAPTRSSAVNAAKGIKLTWTEVAEATGYIVYRGSTKVAAITSGSTLTYTDTAANTSGTTYKYKVCATVQTEDGKTSIGEASKFVSVVKLAKPVVTLENASKGVTVSWKKIAGAKGYIVYRGKTKVKTITSGATVTFTDTAAKANGTKYTYKVYAVAGKTKSVASDAKDAYFLTAPTISRITNSAAKTMTVTWNKNAKATGYEIKYQLGSGTEKTVTINGAATVSKTISGLKKGTTYKVSVRSYKTASGKKYYSVWSAVKEIKM